MVGKALIAISITAGGWFGAGVVNADNVQKLGTYAGDVVTQLRDWGYDVMLNGLGKDALYMDDYEKRHCQVLGIHPVVSGPLESGQFQTVFVDLSCIKNPNSGTNGT